MVITPHNFTVLLSLLCLSHPTISNFINPPHRIFWFGNLPHFFLEIVKNYASVITTIVSNIAVLVSHSAIFFQYCMPMSHGVNKKTPPSASLHLPLPYQVFTRFVCCKYFLLQAFIVFWFPRKLSSSLILAP